MTTPASPAERQAPPRCTATYGGVRVCGEPEGHAGAHVTNWTTPAAHSTRQAPPQISDEIEPVAREVPANVPTKAKNWCHQRLGSYGIYCDRAKGHPGDHGSGDEPDRMIWDDNV